MSIRHSLAFAALSVLIAATPAGAEEKRASEEKRVCKTYPPPVGTRLGQRKVCFTKAEQDRMDEIRAEARGNLERIQQVRQCNLNDCK